MDKVRLGDIATLINGDRGKNYPSQSDITDNGEIPFVNAGHLNGRNIDFEQMNYISKRKFDQLNSGKFKQGDVLYCLRGSLGKKAIVNDEVEGAIASSLVIIRPDYNRVDGDYLMFSLDSPSIKEQLFKANNGSSQPNLSATSVREYEIELPDIQIQKDVVENLSKVRNVIDNRQHEIELLDQLIKARFVEMFGDPVSNPYNQPIKKLSELGTLDRGRSKHRPRNAPELLNGPYPLIQTGEVAAAGLYITNYHNTYSELGLKQSKMWKAGTLCITIAANIAQTAIMTFDGCFPDSVVGFVSNEEVSALYIHYWFGFFQKILEEQAPQVAQKNINLKILSNLEVIVPEREKRKAFEEFVDQVEKYKVAVQKALDKAQLLFDSLMQEYFG